MGHASLQETVHRARTEDGATLALTELSLASGSRPAPAREAFLLIHGLAQTRAAFELGELPRRLLEHGARVFAGELRGHGRSRKHPPPDRRWGLAAHLRLDYPALLSRAAALAETDSVHLIGHSMGGILGYAYLADPRHLASLVTFGAPVVLGLGRPEIRRLARVLTPLLERFAPSELPLDVLLRIATAFSILPEVPGWRGAVRDLVRLGNPHAADAERIRWVLERGAPTTKQVFLELLTIARSGHATIDGIDLVETVRRSPLAVMAVVGGKDIFAPPASVAPIVGGPGRRRVLELPSAAHVDVAIGHETRRVADAVYRFCVEERS
ncbi:MAG: alpha/beta fold hydrolase [Deltaproteobacteria bacterium]|nr:alpha/beta fold hydrolase [Deltaproteobacteria bacterium]